MEPLRRPFGYTQRPYEYLGINAFHGDASAALLKDGELVGAVEEERLNRRKHCAGFPALSVKEVLAGAGVAAADVAHVGRLARSQGEPPQEDPLHAAEAAVLHQARQGPPRQRRQGARPRRLGGRRASAFPRARCARSSTTSSTTSPTSRARSSSRRSKRQACLSIDGFGDFVSTDGAPWGAASTSRSRQGRVPALGGALLHRVTQFLGFHKYGEEWKMMGLAPYGKPTYVDKLGR